MKKLFRSIKLFFEDFAYAISLIKQTSRMYFYLAIIFSVMSGLYGVIQAIFLREIVEGLELKASFLRIVSCALLIVVGLLINKIVSRLLMGLNRVVLDKLACGMELNILKAIDNVRLEQMDDPAFLNKKI